MICKLTRPDHTLSYVVYAADKTIFLCLNLDPRARYWQLETTPIAQSALEIFKLVSPNLFILICVAFPEKTPIKALT